MPDCVCEKLICKLKNYVEKFNGLDEECYQNEISNNDAFLWLKENIPLISFPDETIEEIYYFRWWTYRKHIKKTPEGYIISEFLPNVPWAGDYNSINAAAGHHISEGKWLKCGNICLEDYIRFWLNRRNKPYTYSMWFVSAVWDYCKLRGDYSIGVNNLDALCEYYSGWEKEHMEPCGLFWSIDNYDAMEYTISGTPKDLTRSRGFRPTLNSYMAADAFAISRFAEIAGRSDIAEKYKAKGEKIRNLLIDKLWDGDFFKAQHINDENGNLSFGKMPKDRDVRELIGYIPWCFDLPKAGMETAFSYLKKEEGFYNKYGLTTAEQNHSRFLYEVEHECLWNGYIWPFATAQTLTAVSRLLHNYNQNVITNDDFYTMLHRYAKSHCITDTDGVKKPWIDEVIDPKTGEWSSRNWLKKRNWPNGYERGKDYNHSTFCDIVLSGLFGISVDESGELSVNPLLPENRKTFEVENLYVAGKRYSVSYNDGRVSINKM